MSLSAVSFKTFLHAFPDERACCAYMFHHAKGAWLAKGPCSFRCRWSATERAEVFVCHACGARESAKSGTIYKSSRLPVRTIFYAMLLMCEINGGITRRFLCQHLNVSLKDGVNLINSIRAHIDSLERPEKIGGPGKQVIIDESVLRLRQQGRGIVLGLFDRERLILKAINDAQGSTLVPIIEEGVERGSTLVTDGWGGYNGLVKRGWKHIVIRHGSGSLSDAHGNSTAPIEAVWRSLKEQLAGALGHLSRDALPLYLSEFSFIFHSRKSGEGGFWKLVSSYPALNKESSSDCQR